MSTKQTTSHFIPKDGDAAGTYIPDFACETDFNLEDVKYQPKQFSDHVEPGAGRASQKVSQDLYMVDKDYNITKLSENVQQAKDIYLLLSQLKDSITQDM